MPRPRRFLLSNQSRAFVPTDISGLALWLDASDAASLTLDGSNNVSQWSDKSGNARNVTQSNFFRRPSYTAASQINGVNVVKFDGTDDLLTAYFTSIPQPATVFVVARFGSLTGFRVLYDSLSTNPHGMYTSGTVLVLEAGSSLNINGGTVTVNASLLASGVYNSTSSILRLNRTQIASGNAGAFALTNGISFGANRNGSAPFQGDIAEFAYYSRVLTAGEITQVEDYLKNKWGTP